MKKIVWMITFFTTVLFLVSCVETPVSEVTGIDINFELQSAYYVDQNVPLAGVAVTVHYDTADSDTLEITNPDISISGNGVLQDPLRLNTTSANDLTQEEEYSIRVSYGGVSITLSYQVYDVVVSTDSSGNYDTLMAAISEVEENSTIFLKIGTYIEGPQVVIDKDLTIVGEGRDVTFITPSTDTGGEGVVGAWFLVETGKTLNISHLTLDGNGKDVRQAIRAHGTIHVDHMRFEDIIYPGYYGISVYITNENWTYGVSDSSVKNSDFGNHGGRIGIVVLFSGNVLIENNTFRGNGPGDHLQYGIEVSGESTDITIRDNTFSWYGTSDTAWVSAGILVSQGLQWEEGPVLNIDIQDNAFSNSEYGIIFGMDWNGLHDESEGTIINNNFTDNMKHVRIMKNTSLSINDVLTHNDFMPSGVITEYETSGYMIESEAS